MVGTHIKTEKVRNKTKVQIITKLYKDKFIDDRVLWNLLGSKFKRPEIEEIDKTFRKCFKKSEQAQQQLRQKN